MGFIPAPQAGFNMGDRHPGVECRQRPDERRGRVPLDHNDIRPDLIQRHLEPLQEFCAQAWQSLPLAHDIEVVIGFNIE